MSGASLGAVNRVLNSDIYRRMIDKGWANFTPYGVADAMCAVYGVTVHDLGLSWEVVPDGATKAADEAIVVPTIQLLLALGYGTRRKAFYEWLERRWPR